MSCQRGNVKKSKPPKHQNKTAFKNSMHDTSKKTKALNDMCISGVCSRCRDVIQWKIKYKKYKTLTQPKKCTKCQQKAVKQAYNIICVKCREAEGVCGKCGIALPDTEDPTENTGQTSSEKGSTSTELPPHEREGRDSVSQESDPSSAPARLTNDHLQSEDCNDDDESEDKTDEKLLEKFEVEANFDRVALDDDS